MDSDKHIKKSIESQLEKELGVDNVGIEVSVADGIATLVGVLPSTAEKLHADKIVLKIKGVNVIVEKIEVRRTGLNVSDDQKIAKKVVSEFEASDLIPDNIIKIKVTNGRVTLSGEVLWRYQRLAAEKLTREVDGVTFVKNNISIRPKIEKRQIPVEPKRTESKKIETADWGVPT
jgi:osmotically-inducible protein OsmY